MRLATSLFLIAIIAISCVRAEDEAAKAEECNSQVCGSDSTCRNNLTAGLTCIINFCQNETDEAKLAACFSNYTKENDVNCTVEVTNAKSYLTCYGVSNSNILTFALSFIAALVILI